MFGRGARDPAHGIRYNKMIENYLVSRRQYSFDIARTPQVVKEGERGFLFIDVLAEAHQANYGRRFVDRKQHKVDGRL